MCVWTKKRDSLNAVVRMATPCPKSLHGKGEKRIARNILQGLDWVMNSRQPRHRSFIFLRWVPVGRAQSLSRWFESCIAECRQQQHRGSSAADGKLLPSAPRPVESGPTICRKTSACMGRQARRVMLCQENRAGCHGRAGSLLRRCAWRAPFCACGATDSSHRSRGQDDNAGLSPGCAGDEAGA